LLLIHWTRSPPISAACAVGALLLVALLPAAGSAQEQTSDNDPDWPCMQRLVPEVASGMIWAGPPLDTVDADEPAPARAALAGELAARRVPMAEAEKLIDGYAADLGGQEKDLALTLLFKETLALINQDRSSNIQGIRKFAQGQRALADRIMATNAELDALPSDRILERDTMAAERDRDIRVFDDRRSSLTYLCDQPVLLEQRAFALARAIAGHLE
jgi:hypothetical protein